VYSLLQFFQLHALRRIAAEKSQDRRQNFRWALANVIVKADKKFVLGESGLPKFSAFQNSRYATPDVGCQ
jgi:hypothetical protein